VGLDLAGWASRWGALTNTPVGSSNFGMLFGDAPVQSFLTSSIVVFRATHCVYSRASQTVLPDVVSYYVGRVVLNVCFDGVIRTSCTTATEYSIAPVTYGSVSSVRYYPPGVHPVVSGTVDLTTVVDVPVTSVLSFAENFVSFLGAVFAFGSLTTDSTGTTRVVWTPQPDRIFPAVEQFEMSLRAHSTAVTDPLIVYYAYPRSPLTMAPSDLFVPYQPSYTGLVDALSSTLASDIAFRTLFSDEYVQCGYNFSSFCNQFSVGTLITLDFAGARLASAALAIPPIALASYAAVYTSIFGLTYAFMYQGRRFTLATMPRVSSPSVPPPAHAVIA